jgi:hypothetical protein
MRLRIVHINCFYSGLSLVHSRPGVQRFLQCSTSPSARYSRRRKLAIRRARALQAAASLLHPRTRVPRPVRPLTLSLSSSGPEGMGTAVPSPALTEGCLTGINILFILHP